MPTLAFCSFCSHLSDIDFILNLFIGRYSGYNRISRKNMSVLAFISYSEVV
jgi:hypothetical protein